jgi:hypothetical protein
MLLGAAVVGACAGEGSSATPFVVAVDTAKSPHAVEVRGLARSTVRRLERLAPNDTNWPAFVAVYVERPASDSAGPGRVSRAPPVIGRYVASGDRVRFEPRFPFAEGVAYRVEVDTVALASGTGNRRAPAGGGPMGIVRMRFELPAIVRTRTTRVVAVHPSSSRLPSNLLRWYVETSAPMEPGSALEHVHLMDESGREVPNAFLALDQELWDPDRRRLTLLFDPGRVKRGVRTNLESGAPLIAGHRYRLAIDDEWVDGSGARLASGFELAFDAVEADRRSPDPAAWRLTIPGSGTRAPLVVAFGEPLDHALAARLLEVVGQNGSLVPGSADLAASDSGWVFTPERPWVAGAYSLRAGGALEDVAGNNLVRVFDVDRRLDSAGVDRDVAGAVRSVPFRVN